MVDKINIVANVRLPQYFSQWKVTSINWEMEDNLKYLEYGKRPQLFGKWKTTSSFSKSKMTQLFCEMEKTSMLRQKKDHVNFFLNGM
jgi:hypothetical protein